MDSLLAGVVLKWASIGALIWLSLWTLAGFYYSMKLNMGFAESMLHVIRVFFGGR